MAIKYYCDGCDKEIIFNKSKTNVKIHIEDEDNLLIEHDIQLCDRCKNYLLKSANPKTWARQKIES